jgi:hypothetical protein
VTGEYLLKHRQLGIGHTGIVEVIRGSANHRRKKLTQPRHRLSIDVVLRQLSGQSTGDTQLRLSERSLTTSLVDDGEE